jgi:outer membrane cobalamin receptor
MEQRYISGSNPDLKPETAKSYTLGVVWSQATGSICLWTIGESNVTTKSVPLT